MPGSSSSLSTPSSPSHSPRSLAPAAHLSPLHESHSSPSLAQQGNQRHTTPRKASFKTGKLAQSSPASNSRNRGDSESVTAARLDEGPGTFGENDNELPTTTTNSSNSTSPPTPRYRHQSSQSIPSFNISQTPKQDNLASLRVEENGSARTPTTVDPRSLLRSQHGVVKSRSGSVLSRGFILKNDRLPPRTTNAGKLEFRLKGAPNFRSAGSSISSSASQSVNSHIYGSAQPSITGLRTVLSVLGCHPGGKGRVVWICTREEPVIYIGGSPFVLRDAESPLQTFSLSERPEALESIERRLKSDILREAARYGGVVQVQQEVENEDNPITSTWIAASSTNVLTIRELWQKLREEGFAVDYHRIAVSSDENPENRYLDSFLDVLRQVDTNAALYFNCGVGVVRTTFAMTIALLVRYQQSVQAGKEKEAALKSARPESVVGRSLQRHLIAEADAITRRNRSLLRLTSVFNQCVSSSNQHGALERLLAHPQLLENLRTAVEGDYDMVLSLLSCLEQGSAGKALVDAAIDQCSDIINLREDILSHRISLSLAAMDHASTSLHLKKALAGLERYFFLVAFQSYISETKLSENGEKYNAWLRGRAELRNMVARLRKKGSQTWVFSPISDLSALSRSAQLGAATPLAQARFSDVMREGSEVIGDEFAAQLVRRRRGITLRAGTILKKDIWRDAAADDEDEEDEEEANGAQSPRMQNGGKEKSKKRYHGVRGTINFRRIQDTRIYALSQPTDSGITGVLDAIGEDSNDQEEKASRRNGEAERVTWVNLREEPLVYINGAPYVLREEALSLRNVKSYAGISSTRLELIEDRLKRDILAELKAGDGRILLHSERPDGTVVAVWESVEPEDVATLREVMESLMQKRHFDFKRIPITAEGPPNAADVAELVEIVAHSPLGHSVIINCQLGRGRSTLVSIMLSLFQSWLLNSGGSKRAFSEMPSHPPKVLSYAVINNLIRVIRNGREIKMAVDAAIGQCSEVFNLLDSIEDSRQEVQDEQDEKRKKDRAQRGINDLRRYFMLVLFAAWLNESSGDSLQALKEEHSFEKYLSERPVYQTIYKEIDAAGPDALTPLGKFHVGEGVERDEEHEVVERRNGRILSASTILKSDFFSNLQKLSLPDRVEGAPNYRRAPLFVESLADGETSHEDTHHSIFGTGMPTVDGLRRALDKMGAGQGGSGWVYWTLMREEPVIFVRGRPHVLRLLASPLENVITTGVTADSVEGQESALKSDVIRELEKHDGRLLLHDETDDGNGKFTVTAAWEEDVSPEDILTPSDVYQKMIDDGYRVDYARLPVTDEQAPIPRVFARLEERVAAALQHSEVSMAFNCQMGRGRTTSAMVAASLVASILHTHDNTDGSGGASSHEPSPLPPLSAGANGGDTTFEIRGIEDPYINGEYKIIFQLISVLPYGKLAKQLADRAIDQCEAVQNLRKAVATYKLQWEAAEKGSSKREKVGHIVFNYLYRYGTLIAFANYLLEKRDAQSGQMSMSSSFTSASGFPQDAEFPSFPQYLSRRSEIDSILKRKNLD